MSQKKVSGLTELTTAVAADYMLIYDASAAATKKISFANVRTSNAFPVLKLELYSSMGVLTASSTTDILWNELVDTDGWFASGTSRSNFTVSETAYYNINIRLGVAPATASGKQLKIEIYDVTNSLVVREKTIAMCDVVGSKPVYDIPLADQLVAATEYKVRVYHDNATDLAMESAIKYTSLTIVGLRN